MISIILIARNDEERLQEYLASLYSNDDRKDFELIVVDGNSTDKTREIAAKAGAKVLIQQKPGAVNAKNLGWQNASSDLVIMMECKHRSMRKNALKELETIFRSNDWDACSLNFQPIATNFLSHVMATECLRKHAVMKSGKVPADLCLSIYKKSFLQQLGLFDESLGWGDDMDMAERARKASSKIGFIQEKILGYKEIDKLSLLAHQGKWYGRIILPYLLRYKDFKRLGFILWNASIIPAFILGLFFPPLAVYAAISIGIWLLYSIHAAIITRNAYALLVWTIKIMRSSFEVIGFFDIFKIKHMGH